MKTLNILFDRLTAELKSGKELKDLAPLLKSYSGADWKKYKLFSPRHYTRNVVQVNDILEMIVICWEINQGCPIHDHPQNGCLVRILQGEVRESTYELTTPPALITSKMLTTNGLSYQEGRLIGHEIYNNSGHRTTSLHLYSPPDYKPTYY